MKTRISIAAVMGALTLATAVAVAAGPPSSTPPQNQGTSHQADHPQGPTYTPGQPGNAPGPKAGLPAQAKAYGRYCQSESRKHVKGEKGTPFSRCVAAAAKLQHSQQS